MNIIHEMSVQRIHDDVSWSFAIHKIETWSFMTSFSSLFWSKRWFINYQSNKKRAWCTSFLLLMNDNLQMLDCYLLSISLRGAYYMKKVDINEKFRNKKLSFISKWNILYVSVVVTLFVMKIFYILSLTNSIGQMQLCLNIIIKNIYSIFSLEPNFPPNFLVE